MSDRGNSDNAADKRRRPIEYGIKDYTTMTKRAPRWELDMMIDVAEWWDIPPEEAEMFLEEVGAFGPKEDWVEE